MTVGKDVSSSVFLTIPV